MNIDTRPPLHVAKVTVRNRRKRPVTLRLEPWGEEFIMLPGSNFQIIGRGPAGDTLEVQWTSAGATVYAWPGATVSVVSRGRELGTSDGTARGERLSAPRIPHGMRMRAWIEEFTALAV